MSEQFLLFVENNDPEPMRPSLHRFVRPERPRVCGNCQFSGSALWCEKNRKSVNWDSVCCKHWWLDDWMIEHKNSSVVDAVNGLYRKDFEKAGVFLR